MLACIAPLPQSQQKSVTDFPRYAVFRGPAWDSRKICFNKRAYDLDGDSIPENSCIMEE